MCSVLCRDSILERDDIDMPDLIIFILSVSRVELVDTHVEGIVEWLEIRAL